VKRRGTEIADFQCFFRWNLLSWIPPVRDGFPGKEGLEMHCAARKAWLGLFFGGQTAVAAPNKTRPQPSDVHLGGRGARPELRTVCGPLPSERVSNEPRLGPRDSKESPPDGVVRVLVLCPSSAEFEDRRPRGGLCAEVGTQMDRGESTPPGPGRDTKYVAGIYGRIAQKCSLACGDRLAKADGIRLHSRKIGFSPVVPLL